METTDCLLHTLLEKAAAEKAAEVQNHAIADHALNVLHDICVLLSIGISEGIVVASISHRWIRP